MASWQRARLLAVKTAFVCRGFSAAEEQLAKADELVEWLTQRDDLELRCNCLELALTTRTGGSTASGLLLLARGVYAYVMAGAPAPRPEVAPPQRASRRRRA